MAPVVNPKEVTVAEAFRNKLEAVRSTINMIAGYVPPNSTEVPYALGGLLSPIASEVEELRDLFIVQLIAQGESHRKAAASVGYAHSAVINACGRITKRNKTRPFKVVLPTALENYIKYYGGRDD